MKLTLPLSTRFAQELFVGKGISDTEGHSVFRLVLPSNAMEGEDPVSAAFYLSLDLRNMYSALRKGKPKASPDAIVPHMFTDDEEILLDLNAPISHLIFDAYNAKTNESEQLFHLYGEWDSSGPRVVIEADDDLPPLVAKAVKQFLGELRQKDSDLDAALEEMLEEERETKAALNAYNRATGYRMPPDILKYVLRPMLGSKPKPAAGLARIIKGGRQTRKHLRRRV